MEPRRMIEAALFMSGREMSVPELKKLTGIASAGHVKEIVGELMREYDSMGSSLEIFEGDNAYLMRVRDEYAGSVRQFAQDVAISRSALRTLSYIARHNGILKSEVVKRIGTGIYDDVKELVQSGFIFQRKFGRSSKLFLTDKFRAYFEKGEVPAKKSESSPSPSSPSAQASPAPSSSDSPSESGDSGDGPPADSPDDGPPSGSSPASENAGDSPPDSEEDFSFSDMDESGEEKFGD